ncbi:MAG: nitroreductase family deazaflavin-dependent oxidoreductase [Chloroflexi bacterium]|nr:nitroreductase family deazaflavin-dependent oxidoreductase [Chloroflexota bacterium]
MSMCRCCGSLPGASASRRPIPSCCSRQRAKSGKERTVPLLYVDWEAGFGVIGTRFGSQQHPSWYHNLSKNPEAVVEIKGKRYECTAREIDGDERVEIWKAASQMYEGYDANAPRAKRKIPVLILMPKAGNVS